MSIKASAYVWEHSEQKGTALLLLLALSDMANEEGIAWPGVTRLAKKARTKERNAQLLLRKLEEQGELEVGYGTGRCNTNVYALKKYRESLVEKGENITPLEAWAEGKGAIQRQKGAIQRTERVQPTTPETLGEPSMKHKREEDTDTVRYLDEDIRVTVSTLRGIKNWDKDKAQTISLVSDTKATYPDVDVAKVAKVLAYKLRNGAVKYKFPARAFPNWVARENENVAAAAKQTPRNERLRTDIRQDVL